MGIVLIVLVIVIVAVAATLASRSGEKAPPVAVDYDEVSLHVDERVIVDGYFVKMEMQINKLGRRYLHYLSPEPGAGSEAWRVVLAIQENSGRAEPSSHNILPMMFESRQVKIWDENLAPVDDDDAVRVTGEVRRPEDVMSGEDPLGSRYEGKVMIWVETLELTR